jgi:hypothetical protein
MPREEEEVVAALEANRKRRKLAERELRAARAELAKLLAQGRRLKLSAATMAKHAGVHRDTVYAWRHRKRGGASNG